jgi:F0F1-type ATP synthase membrane subunit b/b'
MLIAFIIAEGPGWWARLEPYLDYPGFEAWKFLNLAVFVAVLVIALRKFGVREMFRDRKETIARELARAQQERDAALAKLKEVEERLALLDTEVAKIKQESVREAAAERERIAELTRIEIAKLGEQAQSVRLAEEIVRREMRPEDDARLIANNIEEIGGAAQ